jgi:hypothetical protein
MSSPALNGTISAVVNRNVMQLLPTSSHFSSVDLLIAMVPISG